MFVADIIPSYSWTKQAWRNYGNFLSPSIYRPYIHAHTWPKHRLFNSSSPHTLYPTTPPMQQVWYIFCSFSVFPWLGYVRLNYFLSYRELHIIQHTNSNQNFKLDTSSYYCIKNIQNYKNHVSVCSKHMSRMASIGTASVCP